MGHHIGVSASYYKPAEREVIEDYLKAGGLAYNQWRKIVLQKQLAE